MCPKMPESTLLSGKVHVQSLFAVHGRPGPEAPRLKRLFLSQRELAQFYDGTEGICYMAAVELRAGSARGNHFHRVKEEQIYLMQGELKLVVGDIESSARESITLKAGDLAVISPRVAHALHTLSPGWAIEFSTTRFDPSDIHPFDLR